MYAVRASTVRNTGSRRGKKRLLLTQIMEDHNGRGGLNGYHNNGLSVDSEEILENAVSLSSAVVSEDDLQSYNSSDLLMIAPTSPSTALADDPKHVIPPLNSKHKKKSRSRISFADSSTQSDELQDSLLSTMKGKVKPEKYTYFGFTKKQWAILVIFGFANILATTAISIQAPFYPHEAEKKGATATEYGFVFGVYQLVMFLTSPIFGSYIGKTVPPKMMFNLGIFTTGTCAILFGFLDYIDDRVIFIALSFVVRIVQSCGDAAYVTASFTIIAMEFPESVATTFAALETCSGIGLIIGPSLGGALFELGGFILPFLTVGCVMFLMAILTLILLPQAEKVNPETVSKGKGFLSLVRVPAVAMATLGIVVASLGIGFLEGTLEPHVRANFQLTPLYTGLIFIIEGGMYALSAPFWGRLCDKVSQPKLIMMAGCLLCFVAFLLIGPVPFMPFPPTLWVTCVGLALGGLGVGATLVSGFIQTLQDALSRGFPNNVATYGIISGLWTSAFALGCFAGPSIGGVLLDHVGFENASIFFLASQALVFFVVLFFLCFSRPRNPDGSDQDPLRYNEHVSFPFEEKEKESQGKPVPKSYGAIS